MTTLCFLSIQGAVWNTNWDAQNEPEDSATHSATDQPFPCIRQGHPTLSIVSFFVIFFVILFLFFLNFLFHRFNSISIFWIFYFIIFISFLFSKIFYFVIFILFLFSKFFYFMIFISFSFCLVICLLSFPDAFVPFLYSPFQLGFFFTV